MGSKIYNAMDAQVPGIKWHGVLYALHISSQIKLDKIIRTLESIHLQNSRVLFMQKVGD